MFIFSDLNHAESREQILSNKSTITHGKNGIFLKTNDEKTTVEVNILSFANNTKNTCLEITLL